MGERKADVGVAAQSPSLSRIALISGVLSACAAPAGPVQLGPAAAPGVSAIQVIAPAAPEPLGPAQFAEPSSIAPEQWLALGPFAIAASERAQHASLDHDYLALIGGEASAHVEPGTRLEVDGKPVEARPVQAKAGVVDFAALYASAPGAHDTDNQVAYAYAELERPQASSALARFGSDDGAAVWVNGQRVHRIAADRGLDPESDRFELPLVAGKNRILVKVDNGMGGWGFALRLFDEQAQRALTRLALRRHLEWLGAGPVGGEFLLGNTFPEIGWRDAELAASVLDSRTPSVRWFGPDARPARHPERDGRYAALIEARTRDGYPYRQLLSFAKVPEHTTPWLRTPPFADDQAPLTFAKELKLSEAEQRELSRQIWHAGAEGLSSGANSAIAASALYELKTSPPDAQEPAWLASGFIRNAAYQLAVRMSVEKRSARTLPPPAVLTPPAGKLHPGSEREAGVKPGTSEKLRQVLREWAAADPNGMDALVVRHGVVFFHESFNGFDKSSTFYPASISKTLGALLVARAVDQGLFSFDTPLSQILPEFARETTRKVSFRYCFAHIIGLHEHRSHGGLFNAYLDNALLSEDVAFAEPGRHFIYNGDDHNLAGSALELVTGTPIWQLLYEQLEKPFAEPVLQTDLGAGGSFNTMYLAKVGQMLLQDGAYGEHRFYAPGFVKSLLPRKMSEFAPELDDPKLESGIGLDWMIDPPGPREKGVLGPNVVGHGASSGVTWRIALDHDLVIVVGRNQFKSWSDNERFAAKLVSEVAAGLVR